MLGAGQRLRALNRGSYNAIVKDWDAARSGLFSHEPPFLKLLTANIRPPTRILDLGCGTGRPVAEFLLQQGYSVTGVDQAENLLALAKERLPKGRWLLSQMEHFEPDEEYDGAVLWDSLFHIPREHHESILRKVVGSLRRRSRLILTSGGSDHPPFTDSMYGQWFYYDSHAPTEIVAILKSVGCVIEHAEFINPPAVGRDKGRYGIVANVP